MKLLLINPRGFCAGVVRAIEIVEKALQLYGPPIFVKHQIVHNQHVVDRLEKMGAVFIEEISEVPYGSKIIYSAHGVAPDVRKQAKQRALVEIDATCSLVTRIHSAVIRFAKQGYHILLIGHKNHVEVIGTFGEAPHAITIIENEKDVENLEFSADQKLCFVTQTTLSMFELEDILKPLLKKYPNIETLPTSSICYATTNRQKALKEVAALADIILVVGDVKSSNSNRLQELGIQCQKPSYLIQTYADIRASWLTDCETIVLTAGASTPENIVQDCVKYLRELGVSSIDSLEMIKEDTVFQLPKFPK